MVISPVSGIRPLESRTWIEWRPLEFVSPNSIPPHVYVHHEQLIFKRRGFEEKLISTFEPSIV